MEQTIRIAIPTTSKEETKTKARANVKNRDRDRGERIIIGAANFRIGERSHRRIRTKEKMAKAREGIEEDQ